MDIIIASLALFIVAPLMLGIAAYIKLSSKGPIIFKQHRYGIDGEEFTIYKFRTMTVCEDDDNITQASKNEARITSFGNVLRQTSMDELLQFINVLQNRMSVVGPRPHAVAHNEQYRKLIMGYAVRHKVKSGITGWAQVNGYRGNTSELEQMKYRIDYDLDYLRGWSLGLDLEIIFRTIRLIFNDRNAY